LKRFVVMPANGKWWSDAYRTCRVTPA